MGEEEGEKEQEKGGNDVIVRRIVVEERGERKGRRERGRDCYRNWRRTGGQILPNDSTCRRHKKGEEGREREINKKGCYQHHY